MRYARLMVLSLLGLLLCALPGSYTPTRQAWAAQTKPEKKEVKVWVNTASGVYHCPGARWYRQGKSGASISSELPTNRKLDVFGQHYGVVGW